MKKPIIVPVDQLIQEPYASVLCFPKPSEAELQSRLQELHSHGVTALEFSGTASLFGVAVPVLGKGFVGIVVFAHLNGERVAVKIRRVDADRADLLHEARMLSKANSVNVAPKLMTASKNFLLMQLIDGDPASQLAENKQRCSSGEASFGEVLEQCFRLDQVGLDHGELSKAPKHLLVDKTEKALHCRFRNGQRGARVANVTSVCQYLSQATAAHRRFWLKFLEKGIDWN